MTGQDEAPSRIAATLSVLGVVLERPRTIAAGFVELQTEDVSP